MPDHDDITHYDAVEAYCGRSSAAAGDELTVHVRCETPTYDVDVHRWGAERSLVWSARALPGTVPVTPDDADAAGCGWPVSFTIAVPAHWRSGLYHLTLRAVGAEAHRSVGHAAFVVRATAERAPALLVLATNTYQAYNAWGGRSLYTGGHAVSFRRPYARGTIEREPAGREDRKAPPRRAGELPDVDGDAYQAWRIPRGYPGSMGSAGWFTYERRFVEWAEHAGFDLDMAVSTDLADDPTIVEDYPLVLGVGHDEYWSVEQRDAIERYVEGGGNYASFSGNTMFWQVRLDGSRQGFECYKYRAHVDDPVVAAGRPELMTGMWCDPLVGRPEAAFLGAGSAWGLYSRFGMATPRGAGGFTVYRAAHWLLTGTGLRFGDLLGADDGVVGYETVGCRLGLDELQLPVAAGGDGTPPDVEVVAICAVSNLAMGEYPRSIAALDDQGDLEFIAGRLHGLVDGAPSEEAIARHRHGHAVMAVARPFGAAGGEVVTVGTTDWVYGLGDPAVARVTENVLRRYA